MYKIGQEFYIIKTNLQIIKIKVCEIIITKNNIRYNYTYADNKIHFNSLWNANYLRNNGKLLKFKTEKQARKYIKREEYYVK